MSLAKYLFSSTEHAIVTQRWHACLSKEAYRFEHCAVKSVVHVKSISSLLAHEYLHAAIENTVTGARTRIIMERNVLDDLVVLGRWGSTSHSLTLQDSIRINPQHRLPVLPLRSLEFTTNDFKVIELAKILEDTTAIGCYTLFRRNCYWFASVVYKSIKDQFPMPPRILRRK
ncbi:hypothetical protein K445DRAFT_17517 [Daldinia sp. EC12]|nr:hypothetical protein K445DRAFT_17517 [Daldinia sp. EC12]